MKYFSQQDRNQRKMQMEREDMDMLLLINFYSNMFQTPTILEKLLNGLGISWSAKELKDFCFFCQLSIYLWLQVFQEINGIRKICKDTQKIEKQ